MNIKINNKVYTMQVGDCICDNGHSFCLWAGDDRVLMRRGRGQYRFVEIPPAVVKEIEFSKLTLRANGGLKEYFYA